MRSISESDETGHWVQWMGYEVGESHQGDVQMRREAAALRTHLGEACRCMCAKTCSMARGMIPLSSDDAPRLKPSMVNVLPVPCIHDGAEHVQGTISDQCRSALDL